MPLAPQPGNRAERKVLQHQLWQLLETGSSSLQETSSCHLRNAGWTAGHPHPHPPASDNSESSALGKLYSLLQEQNSAHRHRRSGDFTKPPPSPLQTDTTGQVQHALHSPASLGRAAPGPSGHEGGSISILAGETPGSWARLAMEGAFAGPGHSPGERARGGGGGGARG